MRNLTTNNFALLRSYAARVSETPPEVSRVLEMEEDVLTAFRRLVGRSLTSKRIRTHGDLHLGQILYTGNDFVITDFEGEPARSLNERRIRRSPLRDVAGMLRSHDYAVHSALQEQRRAGLNEEAYASAAAWGRFWQASAGAIFLRSYLETAAAANLLTASHEEIELLLDVFVLEKAVYELAYELNNRPDWLGVPLQGIIALVAATQ
jgi:maltose alpha-D-glucosyltransferase/alpha-amylase